MPNLKPRSFKLNNDTIEQLKILSRVQGNTLSGTVRQLIRHAYEHTVEGIPRCASGSPCLVPATWEQHMALRRMAEQRAADKNDSAKVPDLPLQPTTGQTDIDPATAFHTQPASFLTQY